MESATRAWYGMENGIERNGNFGTDDGRYQRGASRAKLTQGATLKRNGTLLS